MSKLPFYLITGLSGAGKSQALQAFEDMGYNCVDNLPSELLDSFISLSLERENRKPVALILDVREEDFVEQFPRIKQKFSVPGVQLKVLFLEASDEELLNRYRESRRLHPLADRGDLEEAINVEREMLRPIRSDADIVVDTTKINTHQFKGLLIDLCHPDSDPRFVLVLISFGFKFGVPRNLDFLFDTRFLNNPHYDPDLKPFTGLDEEIVEFMGNDSRSEEYLDNLQGMIDYLIKCYTDTDKTTLFVGLGCTGGRHRSVYMADRLQKYFADKKFKVVTVHRDMEED
ncbi:MAG: RNase adapter RapZ [bacterium]